MIKVGGGDPAIQPPPMWAPPNSDQPVLKVLAQLISKEYYILVILTN